MFQNTLPGTYRSTYPGTLLNTKVDGPVLE